MKSQKIIFLFALITTIIIFSLGISFGYMLESARLAKIDNLYSQSEKEIINQNIDSYIIYPGKENCTILAENNILFGDRIYNDALMIQKYEDANQLSDKIIAEHKKYDLLRTLFWTNSIKIKSLCNSSYHNVVYIYDYNSPSLVQTSMQRFFSNLLYELKNEHGSKIMLIPIAGDNNLSSISTLMQEYNVTELPVILIDEKIKITELSNKTEIEKYLN
jgi:hypothetical protein